MISEEPKCNSCGQTMFSVGEMGRTAEINNVVDGKFELVGIRDVELYQCPECKDVKIY
jgi:hypothetical protein